jgi:hypothetical protein
MLSRQQKRIAKEIELVLERLNQGESTYSKGEVYNDEYFFRSDLALVVLNNKNEIRISFADHARPSYAALIALLLDEIEKISLLICDDYKTDERGSMILEEQDLSSTGKFIWDDKGRYYSMLKKKVKSIVVRKI